MPDFPEDKDFKFEMMYDDGWRPNQPTPEPIRLTPQDLPPHDINVHPIIPFSQPLDPILTGQPWPDFPILHYTGTLFKTGPLQVKRLRTTAKLPVKAHKTDLGYDIFACLTEPVELLPLHSLKVPTGIAIALPEGYGAKIETRSSMASKGLFVTGGVIDNPYRGEWIVVLNNISGNRLIINDGDKIAQFVLIELVNVDVIEVDELDTTDRGEGGFGSTGK